jgi:integrase
MASIFKSSPRAKKYTILYFDENGRRRKRTGASDKAVSQQIANELEKKVALRRAGLADRRAEVYRDHEARPLADHLADFKAALLAKGGTAKHAQVTEYRARRVVELAKAKRITDLSLSKALDALAALRGEGLGQETINHHVRAVKGFSRWLWRDGRAREHHLAHLSTANPEPDRRYRRRSLTPEEAVKLVNTTETGPTVMGMTGPDRGMLYALAAGSGLRSKELRTLTPERFDLVSDPPTVTVLAGYAKNRREAVQPLPAALADRLAPWIATKPAGKPVFEEMTQRDGRNACDRPEGRRDRARDRLGSRGLPRPPRDLHFPSGFLGCIGQDMPSPGPPFDPEPDNRHLCQGVAPRHQGSRGSPA